MSSNPELALVTGAGRGIGRAIALRLALPRTGDHSNSDHAMSEHATSDYAGIPVVLVARTDREISALRNEIVERGGKAYATPCDVSISSEVAALGEDVLNELGPVTILVNNAGVAPSSKFEETTDEMWREIFGVNVDGAFYTTRAFLPAMIAQSTEYRVQSTGHGEQSGALKTQNSILGTRHSSHGCHIISIASTAALAGFRYTAAYTASKHALLGMMRALAEEFKRSDIKFSTICPGFTRTQILLRAMEATMARGSSSEKAEALYAMLNREGRIIEPEEIAETVYQIIMNRNIESGGAYDSLGEIIGH